MAKLVDAKHYGCFNYEGSSAFFKKLRLKAWLSAGNVEEPYWRKLVWSWMQSNRIVTSGQIKSMVKYSTSVTPGSKHFTAAYYRTGIINHTGIGLRNKTMADNHRLLKKMNQLTKAEK